VQKRPIINNDRDKQKEAPDKQKYWNSLHSQKTDRPTQNRQKQRKQTETEQTLNRHTLKIDTDM